MMMPNQNPFPQIEKKDSAEIPRCNSLKKVKRVSFYPMAMVIQTLHHKNYTKGEKIKCWYIKSDFDQMKIDFSPTIELMEAGETEQQEHCFRGLENRIVQRLLERKAMRKEALKAVFQEECFQSFHRKNKKGESSGISSAEAIAVQYTIFSKYSAFEAYNIGLLDEVEAFRIANLEENRETETIYEDCILDEVETENRQKDHNSMFPLSFLSQGQSSICFPSHLLCTS